MERNDEVQRLSDACERQFRLSELKLSTSYYYASLPLCVIDSVYSIGVRYTSTKNTVKSYCDYFGLPEYNFKNREANVDHTISTLIANIEAVGAEAAADRIFCNHQRTSTRNGILKAEAVLRCARILRSYGIETFRDINDKGLPAELELEIESVPGQKSGLAYHYFCMLSGDDSLAKPDRHVLRFIKQHIGRTCTVPEAQCLLTSVIEQLKPQYPNLSVRLLDYAIWDFMANGTNKSVNTYHKLVRDKIPEIIETSGKTCVTEILSDEEYLKMVDAKLDEELAEYHQDQNLEELADLTEVIRAAVLARGYTLEDLERVRAEKYEKRGGFQKKILLKEVRDGQES